jgi:hypothetical protein
VKNKNAEILPTGMTEGVKTKTNYNLVGLIFGGLVVGFTISCIWLPEPWKEILAVLFAISIIGSPYWIPRMMKQIPPSEQFKVRMLELGFFEVDGKLISAENLHLTSAGNPPQLPPAQSKGKEDETIE